MSFLPLQFEFDHVFRGDVEALGHLGADEDGVVPGELGHRLGEFLQPAVVGELSVVDGGVAADVELDGVGIGFRQVADFGRDRREAQIFRRESGSLDPAIVERLAPELLEVGAGVLLLPVGASEIVACSIGLAGEERDEFQRALAVIERSDQRLDDADGAVVGAGIAPGFEFVRLVHVPLTEFGGFVLIEP